MATKKTGRKGGGLNPDLVESARTGGKLLVRLKPYAPKKGYVLRAFTAFNVLFQEDKGWYQVDRHVGEYLRTIRCRPDQPGHAHFQLFAFDVCTPDEARKIAEAENEEAVQQGRAMPHKPNKVALQARDVTTGTPLGPKKNAAPPPDFDPTAVPRTRKTTIPPERSMRAASER